MASTIGSDWFPLVPIGSDWRVNKGHINRHSNVMRIQANVQLEQAKRASHLAQLMVQ